MVFYHAYDRDTSSEKIPLSTMTTKDGDNYVCELMTFVMSEGKLERIEWEGKRPYDGVYVLPTTIADILPDDFPTSDDWDSPENAWVAGNGNQCYKGPDDSLLFRHQVHLSGLDLSRTVIKNGENYYCDGATFVMSGENLIRIEYHYGGDTVGVYAPPQKIGEEALTVADILPDDFPTTDDWTFVPENAWVAEKGNRCYKENDDTLYFIHETYWGMEAKLTPLSTPVTEDGDNYICDDVIFVMSEDILKQIEINGGTQYDGIYVPPEKIGRQKH